METMRDIPTLFRKLEQNKLKKYFVSIENPPSLKELKKEYPDIAEEVDDILDNVVCIDHTTRELSSKEEIENEKYDMLLEHHNNILLGWLRVSYSLSPFVLAVSKVRQIIAQYDNSKYPLSKSEYLQNEYRVYRDFVNRKLYGVDLSLLTKDYGYQQISDAFNPDDPLSFQELMTAYFIAFLCQYFCNNHSLSVEEQKTRLVDTLMSFLEQTNEIVQAPVDDLFMEVNNWFSKEQDTPFEFEKFSGKEEILEMLEDLKITENGKYCGGERSKSQILGFVKACKEYSLLPKISDDLLNEQIAKYIGMGYKSRLKYGGTSKRTYDETKRHLKNKTA